MGEDPLSNRNVTRPHLNWIDNRCFRVVGDYNEKTTKPMMLEQLEAEETSEELAADDSTNTYNIQTKRAGQYEASLHIPSVCYGYIIGMKNKTRADIEKSTKTKIIIPDPGKTGDVVVVGSNVESVRRACERIMLKVAEKRDKMRPTHFICLPCNSPEILEKFEEFKKQVIETCSMEEVLFQTPMKLHLTLAMLTLLDDSEVEKASQIIEEMTLTSIKQKTNTSPITFTLQGIEIMKDDFENVDVLFGCVEQGQNKQVIEDIGNELKATFDRLGLGNKYDKSPIKLHATLMNSKFKLVKVEAHEEAMGVDLKDRTKRKDCSFNAIKIFESFKDFGFGLMTVNAVRLSQCGSSGPDKAHKIISEHNFTV